MRALYPGRFQPFHLSHLKRVQEIIQRYPDHNFFIGVADWKGKKNKANFLSGDEASEIATISLRDGGIEGVQVLKVELRPDRSLVDCLGDAIQMHDIGSIFSGSSSTLEAARVISNHKELVIHNWDDNEKGVRSTDIRDWIIADDARWINEVTPSAAEFLRNPLYRKRLIALAEGIKRPWTLDGEVNSSRGERRY
ncbi:hypothetical protein A3D00_04920 [Candidatus Woesebacteria bacterium RIFCSPHIGHO2_02_FULL_38_9]|uniref:Cytidyltransferase-like domain-containing protein n=1 Tax=Candidatus Woesebacteria bacterium RIFCSPHIGHO2_01_FULL_39_28 TaxID=1802496 RepID=A0A1F7YA09_9BACT|nr:MAG: hypothetical protein A2627_03560 [Candidatus Woesebacteria bacterium RIFCSPHIGHO2_01_FULL_39_28]OGM34990.1 MAG: hypothetical protein A3D00_04920 [Candidatus Woesebacteria bacterium RIFCSPHIGHO2_02_FULL_38_9]OGM57424.1 MAG: hypothetical protein A3A50_05835 [Candidatus Woesebacteria bacterium RIFCSPLOWO2_01_FULL_38_20]